MNFRSQLTNSGDAGIIAKSKEHFYTISSGSCCLCDCDWWFPMVWTATRSRQTRILTRIKLKIETTCSTVKIFCMVKCFQILVFEELFRERAFYFFSSLTLIEVILGILCSNHRTKRYVIERIHIYASYFVHDSMYSNNAYHGVSGLDKWHIWCFALTANSL